MTYVWMKDARNDVTNGEGNDSSSFGNIDMTLWLRGKIGRHKSKAKIMKLRLWKWERRTMYCMDSATW